MSNPSDPPFAVRIVGTSFLSARPAIWARVAASVVFLEFLELPVDLIAADQCHCSHGDLLCDFEVAFLWFAVSIEVFAFLLHLMVLV